MSLRYRSKINRLPQFLIGAISAVTFKSENDKNYKNLNLLGYYFLWMLAVSYLILDFTFLADAPIQVHSYILNQFNVDLFTFVAIWDGNSYLPFFFFVCVSRNNFTC
jgi:hypothetical protein